jgi:hypothetical protein
MLFYFVIICRGGVPDSGGAAGQKATRITFRKPSVASATHPQNRVEFVFGREFLL